MKSIKVWTDEEKLYINENFRYEPDTGFIYYKKKNKIGQKRKMDKPVGSYEGGGYLQISMVLHKYQWRIRAHRVAWYLYYGKVPSNLIDHIDHNRTNNKIDNLRESNSSKNVRHSSIQKAKLRKRAEGNCIGVFKRRNSHHRTKPYQVMHHIDGKTITTGYYATMVEAAKARDAYAIERFGSDCGPTNKDIGIY
tara:strand:+ start:570 stop:1151 length:582 start_codon:yes stop_codon:yes gene_type:complete